MGDLGLVRTTASAAIMADFAIEQGASLAGVLRETGIDAGMLRDATAEITAGRELQLIRNLLAAVGDRPGLGFDVGPRYRAAVHGVFGYALISSPTIRHALDIFDRYFVLSFSYSRATVEFVNGEPRLYLDDSATPADVRGFLTERDVSGLLSNWAELFDGQLPIRRIGIAEPLFDRLAPLVRNWGADVVAAHVQTLVLDPAVLDRPMPQASAEAAALLERQCGALLQQRVRHVGVAAQVRDELVRGRSTRATQDDVAAALGMSVRTMRRRLADEDTSFRALSAETFGLLGEELLAAGLTVESVAARLGYADPSNFANAFKRWKGQSPGRYARAHQ